MDVDEQQRVAANEAVYRDVNESIERGLWPGEDDQPAAFRCECAKLGCSELIKMTRKDYERVRSDARHFLVLPGHEVTEAETVVERRDGYLVVEKRGEAGERAEASDPRG